MAQCEIGVHQPASGAMAQCGFTQYYAVFIESEPEPAKWVHSTSPLFTSMLGMGTGVSPSGSPQVLKTLFEGYRATILQSLFTVIRNITLVIVGLAVKIAVRSLPFSALLLGKISHGCPLRC
jgi:hypothetical protein